MVPACRRVFWMNCVCKSRFPVISSCGSITGWNWNTWSVAPARNPINTSAFTILQWMLKSQPAPVPQSARRSADIKPRLINSDKLPAFNAHGPCVTLGSFTVQNLQTLKVRTLEWRKGMKANAVLVKNLKDFPTYLQAGDYIIREYKRSLRVCVCPCEYFWFLTKAFPSWGKFIKFDVASQTPQALIWTKFGLRLLRQWNTRQTSLQTQTSRKALFRRSLANFGKNMHQWYQCTKPKWSRESCG